MKFNKLIPELVMKDLSVSLKFYVEILGFKIDYERKENKFVFISKEGSQLMLEEKPYTIGMREGVNFQIEIENVEELQKHIQDSGYVIEKSIYERWYQCGDKKLGQREFQVKDPDGYLLRFVQDLGER